MTIIEINDSLKKIYKDKDTLSYDKIYDLFKTYVNKSSEHLYEKMLLNKDIYTTEDIIKETWLNFWLQCTDNQIVIKNIDELYQIFIDIIYDVVTEFNN